MGKKNKKTFQESPAKKEKVRHFTETFFDNRNIFDSIGLFQRNVMSIDQSYTSTGVSFLFFNTPVDKFIEFTQRVAPFFSHFSQISLEKSLTAKQTFVNSPGGRFKARGFGVVLSSVKIEDARSDGKTEVKDLLSATTITAILHGHLAHPYVDSKAIPPPEWELAKWHVDNITTLLNHFLGCTAVNSDVSVTLEGLAMGGSAMLAAALPALGLLYGRLWEELSGMQDKHERLTIKEMPISGWKKTFAGHGKAKKNEIKAKLNELGFTASFETDDESDAVAMSLCEGILLFGKKTNGRMRQINKDKLKDGAVNITIAPPIEVQAKE